MALLGSKHIVVLMSLALGACEADLKIKTSDLLSSKESDQKIVFDTQEIISDKPDDAVAWKAISSENASLVYRVRVSSNDDCSDVVHERSIAGTNELNLSGLADGKYFLCGIASTSDQNSVVMPKSATKIIVDTTPPELAEIPDSATNSALNVEAVASDVTTLSYSWELVNGPATATFAPANESSTTITFPVEGVYRVRVLVQDQVGHKNTQEFNVAYDTTPPDVNAGGNQCAYAGVYRNLDATVSGAITYNWTKTAGPGTCTFGTPTAVDTTVSCSAVGSVTLNLSASDEAGNSTNNSLVLSVNPSTGAAGTMDPCFGVKRVDHGADVYSSDMILQPDNKVLIAGSVGSNDNTVIIRFNADGTADQNFGTSGKIVLPAPDGFRSFTLQSDGKLVLMTGSAPAFTIRRYNVDGTLDTTFNGTGIATFAPYAYIHVRKVKMQDDGKIVIAMGHAPSISGSTKAALMRINSNGTVDTTFGVGGIVEWDGGGHNYFSSVAPMSNGKLLAVATLDVNANNQSDVIVARFNANGSLDTTFAQSGLATVNVNMDNSDSILIQPDGSILIGMTYSIGFGHDVAVVRLTSNGVMTHSVMDPLLTSGSASYVPLALQADGKILVTSSSANMDKFIVARLNAADLSLDTSFGTSGRSTFNVGSYDMAHGVAVDSNGMIILGGSATFTNRDLSWMKIYP